MSNMNRLSLAIDEICASCQEKKCEGCKMHVNIGDKIIYVNGKTHEILDSKKKNCASCFFAEDEPICLHPNSKGEITTDFTCENWKGKT